MSPKGYDTSSTVEKVFRERSGFELLYAPAELIPCIIVPNFPELGRLTSLRFLEWVQKNPEGVVSLPTGKTPEHFIKHTERYLANWDSPAVSKELRESGLDPARRPRLDSLKFVQIDEFYPIEPSWQNSFHHYIRRFYFSLLGFDPAKALLIDSSRAGLADGYRIEDVFPGFSVDLTLRTRTPRSRAEELQQKAIIAVDKYCSDYEDRIRAEGGIGFFLGGIGPDGHIAFNVRWSDPHSTTRLTGVNYPTAAAAATDLGGIETAAKRLVITIGLSTITHRPDVTAIIMAAGEAKSAIVADAIQKPASSDNPASILQSRPGGRFYLTRGAASRLEERNFADFRRSASVDDRTVLRYVTDLSVRTGKRLDELSADDFNSDRFCAELPSRTGRTASSLSGECRRAIIGRIERSRQKVTKTRYLHTGPHHDDIILGYLGYLNNLLRESTNSHRFLIMTSGFTSVTNAYVHSLLSELERGLTEPELKELIRKGYFDSDATSDVETSLFLEGHATREEHLMETACSRRLLRNLFRLTGSRETAEVQAGICRFKEYLAAQTPGTRDTAEIQKLKGGIREWEEDCLWGYFGFRSSDVVHARLGFYTGDIFTPNPGLPDDVLPVLAVLRETKPDVVSVALDPEGSGPDTHYKVMQAVSEALKLWEKESGRTDIRVLGYRNVWYSFHPSEADIIMPVSLRTMTILNDAFLTCYASQRTASFPSYAYQGPFSELAQRIQFEQYGQIRSLLGPGYFLSSEDMLIRASKGFMYLRDLSLSEFYALSRELKESTETV